MMCLLLDVLRVKIQMHSEPFRGGNGVYEILATTREADTILILGPLLFRFRFSGLPRR